MKIGLRSLLVVEDSDEDFYTVCDAVKRSGLSIELRRASTGDECMKMIAADENISGAELVLLDLNLPGTDGREVLAFLKSEPARVALPILILTTSKDVKDIDFCYQSGANAYHLKPLQYADHLKLLLEVFAYWLGTVTIRTEKGASHERNADVGHRASAPNSDR